MTSPQKFYIVKRMAGDCDILPSHQVERQQDPTIVERLGPFDSVDEAISRRVGLIRAGKCQPQ